MPRGFLLVGLFAALVSCTASPPVTVLRMSSGERVEDVNGDPVKLKRGTREPFAGARGGFYVIRGEQDWRQAWPADRVPDMPAIDTSSQMYLLAVSDTKESERIRIERVVETGSFLHVWVRETRAGQGCRGRPHDRAVDVVTTARADKPVKFYVTEDQGDSCGEPPEASIECRLAKQQTWSKKVEAQPGDVVECLMTARTRGRFALVDQVLGMGDLPPGSSAKMLFKKGADRGELEVDVYGTYTLVAEAADEGGRRGKSTATIEVKPPKTKDVLVQLVWAGFDRADSPDTFPRVDLRVAEEGPNGQRCSAQIPVPGLCDVKTRGPYTYMRVPEGNRRLPVSVQFLDERVAKGPGPCVHVWFDGNRTTETCDRKHRDAEEIWKVGVLDTATGQITLDDAPPAGDAGAPASDAGTK